MNEPKERPILFSGEMVRAILDGRKTMTRRVVKPQPYMSEHPIITGELRECLKWQRTKSYGTWMAWESRSWEFDPMIYVDSPYAPIGGLLWVRESFSYITKAENEHFDKRRPDGYPVEMLYRADATIEGWEKEVTWSPSIFMPRWASRLTLRVTAVRVEGVQEITAEDVIAEGLKPLTRFDNRTGERIVDERGAFVLLWDSINAKRGYSWDSNPFVWVVEFEVVE